MNRKILLYFMVLIVIVTGVVTETPSIEGHAAGTYIKKREFIKELVIELEKNQDKNENYNIIINNKKTVVNGKKVKKSVLKKYAEKYSLAGDEKYCVAALKLGLVTTSELKKINKYMTRAEALIFVYRAEKLVYGETISEEDINFVIENRIKDIDRIKNIKNREGIAGAYISGFIKGSAEEYSHVRTLKLTKKIKTSEAQVIKEKLFDREKRYILSPDFQITRDSKLPKQASLYPYILDSFPNDYYDTGFNGMTSDFYESGKGIGADSLKKRMSRSSFSFVFPFEIKEFNSIKYPGPEFSYTSNVFLDCYRNDETPVELTESSVEFYTYALNVDYRNIAEDTEWLSVMEKYLSQEEINEYIKHCIENKTIIECDRVSADPSAVYWYNGDYNCKVYAHFRVVSDIPLKEGYTSGSDQDKYGYLYPVRRGYESGTLFTRSVLGKMYMGYRIGEWTDFYFNTNGLSDSYGSLNCTNTSRGIMIDYSGLCPWLFKMPFG